MSLYGALFAGVSGITAQSNKLGIISDNIANVNTVGYKEGSALFETLVTNSAGGGAYSPGGVLGAHRQLIDKQGLLSTTNSPTDIAISGTGFFVVNQKADQTGQILYTRAGSFTQDSTGNFKNSAGLFLQAWPLDRSGRLPGEPGNLNTTSSANLTSLETVNVQNLTGTAAATNTVSIGANLNAGQTAFPGADGTADMDILDPLNSSINSKDIMVPSTVDSTQRGDKFIVATGAGLSYTYTYGGFTFGRNVTSAAAGDNGTSLITSPNTLVNTGFTVNNNGFATNAAGSGRINVTVASTATLRTGDTVTITGEVGAIDGVPQVNINGTFQIVVDSATQFHYTASGGATATLGGVTGGGAGGVTTPDPFATTNGSTTVVVSQASHGLATGAVVSISGVTAAVAGIPAGDLNASFVVTVIDADHYSITTSSAATSTGGGGSGTIVAVTRPFVGNIFDATNTTQPFLGVTGTSGYTTASLSFTVTTASTGTVTFTYTSSSPNAQLGQFNNLNNLASAINSVNGLSARVINGRIYVGATDANQALTFANGSAIGIAGPPVQAGIDWLTELGLADIASGSNRFSTLDGLAGLVNASPGLTGTVENPLGDASVKINVNDPLDTITFSDKPVSAAFAPLASTTPFTTTNGSNLITITMAAPHGFTTGDLVTIDATGLAAAGPFNGIPKADFSGSFVVTVTSPTTFTITVATDATSSGSTGDAGLVVTPPNNSGSLLAALGLVDSLNGGSFTPQTTGALGPAYDPTNSAKNMASGAIGPQFSRPVTIFDALGTGHNLTVAFIKTTSNTWAVEVFATPETDVTSSLPDGQLAFGTLTFNGDGSLRSVSSGLSNPININWTNGALASDLTFNWGTAGQPFGTPGATSVGKTDGLTQFDSNYNVNFVNQNGAPVGQLVGVSIDGNGFIIASYNNGETQRLFKIPLGEFANPDELQPVSGNSFAQTSQSGVVNLRQSGSSGVGTIESGSLEASNVELADQLTDMIVAQRSYQANTKVISTANTLLDDLNQILR